MVKAVLLDFDGTLVYRDILDVVCGIVGKEAESERINNEFHAGLRTGLAPLITRINFLKGVSQEQIDAKLRENAYLVPGAKELVAYLNERHIITILNSGNIKPVLNVYQKLLGITYAVGAEPEMHGDIIQGISKDHFSSLDFKMDGVKAILKANNIKPEETLAIGDSPADRLIFEFAGTSIAINPKGDIKDIADYVIKSDLREAIEIIERLSIR